MVVMVIMVDLVGSGGCVVVGLGVDLVGGGGHKNELISFARGIAIASIVMMHLIQKNLTILPGFFKKAATIGGTGVHIFFFCSGFGLYLSFLNNPQTFCSFIRKKFLKIYMPYILVVAVTAFIPFAYDGNRMQAFLSHAFLYKMFSPEYEISLGYQMWYISTLFQFYFIFIGLCRIKSKMKPNNFALGALCISFFWWVGTYILGVSDTRIWGSFCLQYLWEFALGMNIAQFLNLGNKISINIQTLEITTFVGLGIGTVLALYGNVLAAFNDIFVFMGFGSLIILIWIYLPYNYKKVVNWISEISYELFLVHTLVFTVVFHLFPMNSYPQLLIGIIAVGFSLVIASLYHRLWHCIRVDK